MGVGEGCRRLLAGGGLVDQAWGGGVAPIGAAFGAFLRNTETTQLGH